MPSFDIDAMSKQLFEPIEITLGGKTYTVPAVTAEMLDKLTAPVTEAKTVDLCHQLSNILNLHPDEFIKLDIRQVIAAVKFVSEQITAQMELDTKSFTAAGASTQQPSPTASPASSPAKK
jgi:hypothetical protein